MTALGHVLFNLLANSVFSFIGTLGIVYATLRLARIGHGRCRLWLLLMPLVKVVFDFAAGVPESSFLWAKAAGHTQELGSFRFGVGVSRWVPLLDLQLGAFSGGVIYPQSFGDLLDTAIAKRAGAWVPVALAASVVSIGAFRLWTRVRRHRTFLRDTLSDARVIDRRFVRKRAVDVLVAQQYAGVPFAFGILEPKVVFSATTYDAFDEPEREAALQHELAHIAHADLVVLAVVGVFTDAFWFLPGLRGLIARVQSVQEHCADDAAIVAGSAREVLASALVRAGEALTVRVPGAAILSSRTLLAQRVHRLLDATATRTTRLTHLANLARAGIAALITLVILQAIFLGNHAEAFVRFARP